VIVGLLLLLVLIALSAFFSGIESAYISLGDLDLIEIEKSRLKNRKLVAHLLANRQKLISTILVGNNLVNIGASALGTAMAIEYGPQFGISSELAVTLSTILLTLLILIFGEVTPKGVALGHNRTIALAVSPILYPLTWLFTPFTWALSATSHLISRLTGAQIGGNRISESSVINMVEKGEQLGIINERERSLIENVFLFDEREVYPVMTPRTRVFALEGDLTLALVQDQLLAKLYTRVPVYQDSVDHIVGILNLKEALKELLSGNGQKLLKDLCQKPNFVYETQTLSSVLETLKQEQLHMAIVVDEFGGLSGVVTLEDIVEELVGEIFDEKDATTSFVKPMGEHKWLVPGRHDVVTINRLIPGELPLEGDYDSLQGLIMSKLERMPVLGDQVQVGPHKFTVVKMNRNEVVSVVLEYMPLLDKAREELAD